jgi:hypothetical protein
MTMVHNCGIPVILRLNDSFEFYSFFNREDNTLKVTTMFIKSTNLVPVYYCQGCRIIVPEEELRLECSNCHKQFPFSYIMTSPYDSLLCKDCIKEYHVDDCKPFQLPRYKKDG